MDQWQGRAKMNRYKLAQKLQIFKGKWDQKEKEKKKIKYYHLLGKTLIKLQESWVFMSEG